MSNQLELGADELSKISTSWSNLQANNKKHKDKFTTRLYTNLLTSNPEFIVHFDHKDRLKEHATLFGEVLSFVVLYKHDSDTLNEFMYSFAQENQEFTNIAAHYLEPMGNALIKTLKQWFGKGEFGKFDAELEVIWIKIYVFIANSILLYAEDDQSSEAGSTFSKGEDVSSDAEDIQPLNIKKSVESKSTAPTPPPATEKPVIEPVQCSTPTKSILNDNNSIEISLGSNEKYRGFRRSVNTPQSEPIKVKIPESPNFEKKPTVSKRSNISSSLKSMLGSPSSSSTSSLTSSLAPYDPRKSRRSTTSRSAVSSSASSINEEFFAAPESFEEPIITPRSSRRGSVAEKPLPASPKRKQESQPSLIRKLELRTIIPDDKEHEVVPVTTFDPRKTRGHKRSDSVLIPSPDSSEVDEQDDTDRFFNYGNSFAEEFGESKQIDLSAAENPVVPERSLSRGGLTGGTFDYNSFGLKGLAPIVEADYDDVASSKYGSESDSHSSHYGDESTRSMTDEGSSSRASSLSLHNSDYKSSISSGSDSPNTSPNMHKFNGQTLRPSTGSDISYMKSLSADNSPRASKNSITMNKAYSSSCSSLLLGKDPNQFTKRASVGFMRSSFVLKKEMETLTKQENTFAKPPTLPAAMASTPSLGNFGRRSPTTISLPDSDEDQLDDDSFELFKALSPVSIDDNKATPVAKMEGLAFKSMVFEPAEQKNKKSFRRKFSSMFSSKSKSSSASTKGSISSTVSTAPTSISSSSIYLTSQDNGNLTKANTKSSATSSARKNNYYNHSMSDLASINTMDTKGSTVSGFSIFGKKNTNETRYTVQHRTNAPRKGNKYQVKAVPYDLELFK